MAHSIGGNGKVPYSHESFKKAKNNPNQPKQGEEGEKVKFVKEKLKHRVIEDYRPKSSSFKASLTSRPGPSDLPTERSFSNPLRPLPPSRSNILPKDMRSDKPEDHVITNKHIPKTNKPMPNIEELKNNPFLKRMKERADHKDEKI